MEGKKTLLFLTDDCDWCRETKSLLDKTGREYVALDIRENSIAKAIAKKMCGQEICMLIKGQVITKFDRKKIVDAILD